MNSPNTITAGRLVLAVVFFGLLTVYLCLQGREAEEVGTGSAFSWLLDVAVGIFLLAALSDWADGFVARKLDLTTTFGRLADPIVDKIVVCGAFVYFVSIASRTFVQPWMVVLMISREFLVTGIRSLMESQGKAFGALSWGKAKMWIQCVTIITVLVYLGHFEGEGWAKIVTVVAVYGTLVATVGSCIPYLRKAFAGGVS